MPSLPKSMQRLIGELSKLPSIGEKSATRLAYHMLGPERQLVFSLAEALQNAAQAVRYCQRCFFLSEADLCSICQNDSRDGTLLCVVEKPMDLLSIERTGEYRGYYHVLHGLWAPLKGQGPESMKLKELLERLQGGIIKEVIIATGSTVEGDATALYVARLVGELGIKASRLAQGVPKGGDLEYMDDVTISRALQGRNTFSGK
jgi:recombination protein RecR